MVDFVIRMPGKGDEEVLLPIDAKFPAEDYARLVEASEKAIPTEWRLQARHLQTV